MGWCSGTGLFDDTVRLFENLTVDNPDKDALKDEFIYHLTELYAYSDWDCEGDSDYYQDILRAYRKRGKTDYDY